MNRGFNYGVVQGNRPNFGQNIPNNNVVDYRERANQSDRRYDDFYGGSGASGGMMGNNVGAMGNNRGGGNWNGPPQQMGFNNAPAPAQGGGAINGQMLSAVQQQNLINALVSNQQQQNMGLQNQFQNMGQQGRLQKFNNQGNNQFKRGGGGGSQRGTNRGGFGGVRSGDKRNFQQSGGANKPGRKFQQSTTPAKKKLKEPIRDSPKGKNDKVKEPEIEEIDIPDDEVVVDDSLKENVEKLRQRSGEIERNVVDEDVEKLRVFSYTGKAYQCKTCDILLNKETAFTNHMTNKSHVLKVIDARTAKKYQETRDILEIDLNDDDWYEKSELARKIILKQAKVTMILQNAKKAKEIADYNKTPSNFYKFNMELRKSVIKTEDEVVITSLVESTVGVKDFTGGKFFGCEFVRAVTGFHCRLCSINIREAKGVLPHIDTKLHKSNYAAYLKKNPEYEKMQKVQNEDLYDIMSQHDDKNIVLAESPNAEGSQFLSLLDSELVRIPSVMDPELKKKADKEKAKEAEAEKVKESNEEKGEASTKDADAEVSNEVEADNNEEPAADQSAEDAEETAEEDAEEPAEEDAEEPAEEDAEEPADEDAEEPADEDAKEPAAETAGQEEDEAVSEEDPYAKTDSAVTTPKEATVSKSKVKKLVAKVKGK